MAKKPKELPVTDLCQIAPAATEQERIKKITKFCRGSPARSFAPVRNNADSCFSRITDLFELPREPLSAVEALIKGKSNSLSRFDNISSIRALYKWATGRGIIVRRHRPLAVRFGQERVIDGLVRFVAADEKGLFFPVVEPRDPEGFNDRALGMLASLHREICCHGDFIGARICIIKFVRAENGERTIERIWSDELPSFTKEELDTLIDETTRQHHIIRAVVQPSKGKREGESPDEPRFL